MHHSPRPRTVGRRVTAAVCAGVVVVAGLLVHRFGSGVPGDVAGDALYAVLVYLLGVLLLPRLSRTTLAAMAMILCFLIEYLQLTDLPRAAAEVFPPARLVLGAGFDVRDLIVYAVAVLVAMTIDFALPRPRRERR